MTKQSPIYEMVALIVEDDPTLSEIFAITFQLAGFRTVTTFDGEHAVSLIKEIKPEVIVLDLHLPLLMGDDLFSMLKNDPVILNAITILATADSRRASYLQDQVDFVFLKPISFSQLRRIATRIYQAAYEKTYLRGPDTGPFQSGTHGT